MILGEPIILGGGGGIDCVVIISTEAEATVTATLENTSISKTANADGNAVFELKKAGVWTITASLNGETVSKEVDTNFELETEIQFADPILENNSWETISNIAKSGKAANFWAVGDSKSVVVNGTIGTVAINATYYVYILGFDHNAEIEGAGITFGCFKTESGVDIALCDSFYGKTSTNGTKYFNMNHSAASNAGGWKGCDLRYDILGSTQAKGANATSEAIANPVTNTFMAALPSELRAVIKPTTIYSNNEGGSGDTASKVTATIDYLYLLSEFEIFGVQNSANSAEKSYQKQFDYFKAGNSKLKYRHDSNGTVASWWIRSTDRGIYSFCGVDTAGKVAGYGAHASYNVAPIFKVG